MSKVLHKYRGDSSFTDGIIASGKVFLATAHQLNDPFECSLQDIGREWLDKQIETGMQASVAGFLFEAKRSVDESRSFFGVEHPQIQAAIGAVASKNSLAESYDAWRAFMQARTGHPPSDVRALFSRIDSQLVETGIFSLSADPAHPLMWAHYADQHRGLCLGFEETPGSKLANWVHCLQVIYSDELPEMQGNGFQTTMAFSMDEAGRPYTSSYKISFEDETFRRVVSTKPTAWSYEQEVRYIEPFGGLCDWPGMLSECTFRLGCRDDRRQHYIGLLESHVPNEVRLFEIRKVHGTNSLERVPMAIPHTRPRPLTGPDQEDTDQPKQMSEEVFIASMQQLMQQERYGDVIYQTSENLKRNPSSPRLLHLKATAHGLAQDHEKALILYDQLANDYPNVAAGWFGMACALESLGKIDEVVPLLRRASQLEPYDPSIALNLGVHLVGTEETRAEGLLHLRRADKLGHRRAQRIINEVEAMPGGEKAGSA
ncbi:MAG TPA: DUF2971 domain-containing protein [Terracidiphilus sp.]|jgi:hypothetical protein|nr:DUF2971 domain-containing protein [Terracidiphilus sp.]